MRPNTLAEATTRIERGEPLEKALFEFLDAFHTAPDAASRIEMLRDEPLLIGARQDALIGAVAEYLSHEYALPRVPAWAFRPSRYPDHAWHTTAFENAAMREYLTFSSPAEFASPNIFTEERPLRRARGPLNRAGRAPT
ncbi:hypothetical protein [uncultured Bradyrhizobium sp.]|uniref:hypothetical protein n=1 Tax=uncultured Bradyrhizobium sp. TaxID=199684 RepID=UPI0035CC2E91